MFDYVNKKMVVDMKYADGAVFFNEDELVFTPRNCNPALRVEIPYAEIRGVRVFKKTKSRVAIETNKKTYDFYMHKLYTFVELLYFALIQKYYNADMSKLSATDEQDVHYLIGAFLNGQLSVNAFNNKLEEIINK